MRSIASYPHDLVLQKQLRIAFFTHVGLLLSYSLKPHPEELQVEEPTARSLLTFGTCERIPLLSSFGVT